MLPKILVSTFSGLLIGLAIVYSIGTDCKHCALSTSRLILIIIIIIIMKNFIRHGHHGSKHSEPPQHAHSRGSHVFTYTLFSMLKHYTNLHSSNSSQTIALIQCIGVFGRVDS